MEMIYTGDTLLISALLAVGSVLLLTASLNDIALRLLPNWTSAGVFGVGIALRWHDGTLAVGLGAALGVFAGALFCWHRGWLGGGDVKLLAACVLLVPPAHVLSLILLTTLGGGLIALLYLAMGKLLSYNSAAVSPNRQRGTGTLWTLRRLWRVECRRIRRQGPIPYGCAISAAALILLLGPTGPLGN
jgi:prepilin peptidase CpaA